MILVSPCLALTEVMVLGILSVKVSKMFYTMLHSEQKQGENENGVLA